MYIVFSISLFCMEIEQTSKLDISPDDIASVECMSEEITQL